jgi:Bacterial capsule synthesis protein PGA_cap
MAVTRLRRLREGGGGPLGLAVVVAGVVSAVLVTSSSEAARPAGGSPAIARSSEPPAAATQPTPAPVPVASAPSAPPRRRVSIVMTGDVLLHNTLWEQARRDAAARQEPGMDFRPIFASMRPVISGADIAICHLETPLAPVGGPYSGYPVFSVPPQVARALSWLGYDGCTTASNHTLDAGVAGVQRTLATLDRAGIAHAGSARSRSESNRPMVLESDGVRIAVLSYTEMLNGLTPPAGKSWIVNTIDPEAILTDADRAKAAGADVVLVALHWGAEYQHEPSADQRRVARRLLASPYVDLVYGHHAHVVQPFQRIGGKWVAYGLGNHVADQRGLPAATREGVLASFTFTERRDGGWSVAAGYLPTYITAGRTLRVLDLSRALANPRTPTAGRATYRQAWRHVARDVGAAGARAAGLTPVRW